jgi:hypothetical protein
VGSRCVWERRKRIRSVVLENMRTALVETARKIRGQQ